MIQRFSISNTRESALSEELHASDMDTMTTKQMRNRLFALTAILCVLGFVLIGLLPHVFYRIFQVHEYLDLHNVAELLSIIVSFGVFTVGWYGYRQNSNRQGLVIGLVFLAVGLIDLLHMLSYEGMPNFLSENTVSKASTFWIAARLTSAIGLLFAAFTAPGSTRRWPNSWLLLSAVCLYIGIGAVVISNYPDLLPPMFIPGVGQTPLKIFLERFLIVFFAAGMVIFGRRRGLERDVVALQLALLISIASEFSFTLYKSAFDSYNLLGHIYKVAAYYLIFRSLFLSSFQKPYYELLKARNQIEQSFYRIGTALASSLQINDVLQLIVTLASEMLGSKYAAVMLIKNGELSIQEYTGMLVPEGPNMSECATAAKTAVSTKRPVVIGNVTQLPGHDSSCRCQQLDGPPARSIVSVPIMVEDEVLGVLEVYSPEIDAYGDREVNLLSSFARQAAVAIRNSMAYERERQIADMLQRSLLPSVPSVKGLDIAVRYEPSEEISRVGGDLYDVFSLDHERVAIVIGDVCGHGLEAASVMAMTVYMIRGSLIQGMSPSDALSHANQVLNRHEHEAAFVTVFLGILNTRTHEIQYANAGHPSPVVFKDGGCEALELRSGLPLGIDESTGYETHNADLTDAAGLLLYTDGVIEARRQGEFFGNVRLSDLCSSTIGQESKQILDTVVTAARSWGGILWDDIALLSVKWK